MRVAGPDCFWALREARKAREKFPPNTDEAVSFIDTASVKKWLSLFYRDTFCKISRAVNVLALADGNMVSEEL